MRNWNWIRTHRGLALCIGLFLVIFYLYGGYRTANSFDRYCVSDTKDVQETTEGYKLIALGGDLAIRCALGTTHLSVKTYNSVYALWPFYAAPSVFVEGPIYFFFRGGIDDLIRSFRIQD